MKKSVCIGVLLFCHQPAFSFIQYTKICSLYGAGFYYIPISDACLQTTTGVTKQASVNGVITGQIQLAYRIEQLEHKLVLLKAKKKIK